MLDTILIITAIVLGIITFTLWTKLNTARTQNAATERKLQNTIEKQREQIRAEKAEEALLLDAIGDAFLIVNQSLQIKLANNRATVISKLQTLLGRSLPEVFLSEKLITAVEQQIALDEPSSTRIIIDSGAHALGSTHTDGETAWVIQATPLPNHIEDPRYCIILRDVTAEYRSDQVRTDFVANASHELRTPLAIINGYLENLLDDDVVDAPATARRFLTTMRKHGDRLSRLIEDMLVISRLESGEAASINPEPFEFQEAITDVLERLEPLISERNTRIRKNLPTDPFIINGDKFYYTQVLFNLIENAIKQNPSAKITVSITLTPIEEKQFKLAITDDGIGIPSSHLPYIFKRFYRVDKHHTQSSIKGTGLGLSIVKRAIEAHGGTIEAASQPGVHTTFTITAPTTSELPQK